MLMGCAVLQVDVENCKERSTKNKDYQAVSLLRRTLWFRVRLVTSVGSMQTQCLVPSPAVHRCYHRFLS